MCVLLVYVWVHACVRVCVVRACVRAISLPFSQDELAKSITTEQGKTLADAVGDVTRGLREFISIALREFLVISS